VGIVSGVLVFWLALVPPDRRSPQADPDRGGASRDFRDASLAPVDAGPTAIASDSVAPEIPDAAQEPPPATPRPPDPPRPRPAVANDTPVSDRSPRPDPPESICNLAAIKAVCDDARPTRAARSNAQRQLDACRNAGAISSAELEQLHQALLSK
jgi:hypothetical protein